MAPSSIAEGASAWTPGAGTPARPPVRPLTGVACPVLTAAIRQVEARWRSEDLPNPEVARLLAALALAVDQRCTEYVTALRPRPSSRLARRLVDLVRLELLRAWPGRATPVPATRVLHHLAMLEQVRVALEGQPGRLLGATLPGPDDPDLLAEVVHDLRSPLTSILFLAETLSKGWSGPLTEVQQRQLGIIYGAALGLSSLVSDALEFAREDAEPTEGEPAPFSVAELVELVRGIVHPMAVEKGLEIQVTLPLPDHRLGRSVPLSRVLLNLTTNALKFTERGFVEIAAVPTGPAQVEFSVRDSGPGIGPAAQEALFQPFRRSAMRRGFYFSSTGLGLALCRRLVAAMGGTLRYETAPGEGTRFHFELELPPIATP